MQCKLPSPQERGQSPDAPRAVGGVPAAWPITGVVTRSALFGALCAMTAFFTFMSLKRLIAQDEGFYLLAAKLVVHGQLPYLDFFYPQMPLQPYLYGGWLLLFGESWTSLRLCSALCVALTGALLTSLVYERCGVFFAFLACALFTLSRLIFVHATTTKTYALSLLLLVGGYGLLSSRALHAWRPRFFLAGVAFGMAVSVRAPLALVLPVVLLWGSSSGWRAVRSLAVGIGIGLAPSALFFLLDPELFWFNNLGYHLGRAGEEPSQAALRSRELVSEVVFGLRESGRFETLRFPVLLYLSAIFALWRVSRRRWPDLAFAVALVLLVGAFLPVPTYVQYFVVTVPFLILCTVRLLHELAQILPRRVVPFVLAVVAVYLLLPQLLHLSADVRSYTVSGAGVIGINKRTAPSWRIETVEQIAEYIDSLTVPDDTVLALWPGHLLGTQAKPFPGLENHFALKFARKTSFSAEERARYRLVSWEELHAAIAQRLVSAVVVFAPKRNPLAQALQDAGYQKVHVVHQIEIFRRGDLVGSEVAE